MIISDTPIQGLKVVELAIHADTRGFFIERYNELLFKKHGLPTSFAQDNHSRSTPGVVRGLHSQHDLPQGKLVGCIRGSIWDVAVDIRPNSPTFGKYFGIELSDKNAKLLWIPAGFAHGFCVLGDEPADVLYKVTTVYNPKGEIGIKWNDTELNIPWPVKNAIVSARDEAQPSFAEYKVGC